MAIGTTVVVLLSLSSVVEAGVTFVDQPNDANVIAGETVVFKCRVSGYDPGCGILSWIVSLDGDQEFLFGPLNPSTDPDIAARYNITGDPRLGQYDLQIINVQDTDAGLYRCIASTTLSSRAQLTVNTLRPPDDGYPKCYGDQESGVRYIGDHASVRCESKGGIPAAILTWHKEGELLQGHYTDSPHAENTYKWTLSADDNGKILTCTATNPELSTPRTCTIGPFMVVDRRLPTAMPSNSTTQEVAPSRPTLKILPTVNDVSRGDEVVFTCILSVKADGCFFSWKIDDNPIEIPSDKYRFENQNRTLRFEAKFSDDFNLYYCAVRYDSNNVIYASALLRVHGDEVGSPSTQTATIAGVTVSAAIVIVLFIIALLVYLHYRKMKPKPPDVPDVNMTVRTPNGTVLGQAPVDRDVELQTLDMRMFQEEGPNIMLRNQKGKTLYVYQNGEAPTESFS